MNNNNISLKEMCITARASLHISQKMFAQIVGTNQTEISFIERGFIPESQYKIEIIEYLYKIAKLRDKDD